MIRAEIPNFKSRLVHEKLLTERDIFFVAHRHSANKEFHKIPALLASIIGTLFPKKLTVINCSDKEVISELGINRIETGYTNSLIKELDENTNRESDKSTPGNVDKSSEGSLDIFSFPFLDLINSKRYKDLKVLTDEDSETNYSGLASIILEEEAHDIYLLPLEILSDTQQSTELLDTEKFKPLIEKRYLPQLLRIILENKPGAKIVLYNNLFQMSMFLSLNSEIGLEDLIRRLERKNYFPLKYKLNTPSQYGEMITTTMLSYHLTEHCSKEGLYDENRLYCMNANKLCGNIKKRFKEELINANAPND